MEINNAATPKASGGKSLEMIGVERIESPWANALALLSFKTFEAKLDLFINNLKPFYYL